MRIPIILFLVILFGCQIKEDQDENVIIDAPSGIGTLENPNLRYEFEMQQVVDPATGQLPVQIHKKELLYSKKLKQIALRSRRQMSNLDWEPVGPENVGGRTRALALDVRNEDIILAGGVSGGMWKSTNGGDSWIRTSDPATINSIGALVQDFNVGQNDVWYYGTGELLGNSAKIGATPYRGDGIFKSTDNGESWDVLPSTAFDNLSAFDSPFNYTWRLQIAEADSGPGPLYAAIYGGIVRSLDGGITWETVLGADLINSELEDLNESRSSFYTNVLITPDGTYYGTLSTKVFDGDSLMNKGIFRSLDGVNWENITPSSFSLEHDRIVMDYAPSDERVVYFFSTRNDLAELWRFDGVNWSNRSGALPKGDDDLARLDTQGSYNMVVKVHPNDPDVVYVGGTNLYRSTDGFSTISNTEHIGGYDPDESNARYSGHHPDQHEIVFLPSDANRMLTANDGGVRKTNNNRAEDVSWSSLNNGMITSQFYTIALSKIPNNDAMVGGMQDNGTYARPNGGGDFWSRLIGGDGSYCASTPDDLFWYVSFQQGEVFRVSLDNDYDLRSFAQIDPLGGSGYIFVNPFVLDPNNYNRMYLGSGNRMWRNDNLSQAVGGRQISSDVNWSIINATIKDMSVSVMDISTYPANVLYYGTTEGQVYRVDNANSANASEIRLINEVGYVSSISLDPSDADRMMLTYGNYNIPSIYYTEDGGLTLTDVGGNLEENADGTGDGPSVRWCEIIPLNGGEYKYFVGTSVGLYSTNNLSGADTHWIQESPDDIGNAVIRMMDYRSSDGRLVVATHGNGVYVTNILDAQAVMPEELNDLKFKVYNSYPNPFTNSTQISMTIPEDGRIQVYILNNLGQRVKFILDAFQYAGDFTAEWDGTNASGVEVPGGIYYSQTIYKGESKISRLVLNR